MIKLRMAKMNGKFLSYDNMFPLPLPHCLTLARSYSDSDIDCTVIQLLADIDLVYRYLTINRDWVFDRQMYINLKDRLYKGLYTPSLIRVKHIRKDLIRIKYICKEDIEYHFSNYPDLMMMCQDSLFVYLFLPSSKADYLVFMGLSVMLHRLSYGSLPNSGIRLDDRTKKFYDDILNFGKVSKLFRIDLSDSLLYLDRKLILNDVKSLVGDDSFCLNLLTSILHLDVVDENGDGVHLYSKIGIPLIGELTWVLFHNYLMKFDSELLKFYPGIVFVRFKGLVFIACKDGVYFDMNNTYHLIRYLGLSCEFECIRPGGTPFKCMDKMFVLDNEGYVCVYDPEIEKKKKKK